MRKLGIVGGIGWPSTVEYYRQICEASQLYHSNKNFSGPTPIPEMCIESLDINFTVNNRGTSEPGSWAAWDSYFSRALRRLVASGAELIVIASVTPHARLKEISDGIDVPIVSIFEAIGEYCSQEGVRRLLVLGTMPTMTSPAFSTGMAPFGVEVVSLPSDELKRDVVKIIDQLYKNDTSGAKDAIEQVVGAACPDANFGSLAIFLGCTELPLAFPSDSSSPSFFSSGVRYLNASVIHAAYAFQACVGQSANESMQPTAKASAD